MNTFTLDTSGYILRGSGLDHWAEKMFWPDLSPFAQGYIEAMLDAVRYERASAGVSKGDPWLKWDERVNCRTTRRIAFRDLAPETLAAILRDCEAVLNSRGVPFLATNTTEGKNFWLLRQGGHYAPEGFPPLTPYLDDTGKVMLREAATAR